MGGLLGAATAAAVTAELERLRSKMIEGAKAGAEAAAEQVADAARGAVPIGETQDLLASIEVSHPEEYRWEVTAGDENAPYAAYVEYGSSDRNKVPQPYMRPAADVGQRAIVDQITNEVRARLV